MYEVVEKNGLGGIFILSH